MQQFLTGLLFFFTLTASGQTSTENDSITIFKRQFKIPSGCTLEPDNKVKCPNYEISLSYPEREYLKGLDDAYLEMLRMLGNVKKTRITCYVLDKRMKGYKVNYKIAENPRYQIYASGIIQRKAVIITLSLDKEPITNEDIPEFARQIIKLTK